jgi:hypothetical protein
LKLGIIPATINLRVFALNQLVRNEIIRFLAGGLKSKLVSEIHGVLMRGVGLLIVKRR